MPEMSVVQKINTFCRVNDMVFKETEGSGKNEFYVFIDRENKLVRYTFVEIKDRIETAGLLRT
jgi:hypothetical protein